MKIRYISDVHLEFYNPNKMNKFVKLIKPGLDEVLILAGDIGNPYSENYDIFMNYVDNNFKKIFVIAGNHEFYKNNKTIEETNEYLMNYFKKFNNITFLNNTIEKYEEKYFIGTILWSKITKTEYEINDTKMIKDLNINVYNNLNKSCIDFLEDSINKINDEDIIIITHHLPSYDLIDKKYKIGSIDNYNEWFYSDLNYIINENKNKIKCWFYGHTHAESQTNINNILFLCNPIGYPGENYNVNFNKVIEIN